MILGEWWNYYGQICEEFSFDPHKDYVSSLYLSSRLGHGARPEILEFMVGRDVNVYGNGRNLRSAMAHSPAGISVVADSAIDTYLSERPCPDVIVTDLDGNLERIVGCAKESSILVIHAHGDNSERIKNTDMPASARILGTTQNIPLWNIRNFGGFTDGDRAAFMADEFGARRINLIGFDFESPNTEKKSDPSIKCRKLKWAELLLGELAKKRGTTVSGGDLISI